MNDDTVLNLEMQMQDLNNWPDRALNYTCRNFTHLQKGHDYTEAQPVIHIGFLDYTYFQTIRNFMLPTCFRTEKEQAEKLQEQADTIQEQADTIDELTTYIKELEKN